MVSSLDGDGKTPTPGHVDHYCQAEHNLRRNKGWLGEVDNNPLSEMISETEIMNVSHLVQWGLAMEDVIYVKIQELSVQMQRSC